MRMKSPSNCKCNNARFMQPLLPKFLTTFSIPVAFVKGLDKELKGHTLESVVLTTEDEPHRHRVIKVESGRHFKDGWKEFCEHHGLKVGDILVFIHQTQLLFQVLVFDPSTSCQRNFSSCPRGIPRNNSSDSLKATRKGFKFNSNEGTSKQENKLKAPFQGKSSAGNQNLNQCRVTLTSYSIKSKIIYIPKYFTRCNGLKDRNCDIKLIDKKGRSWQAKLKSRKCDSLGYLCGGWSNFQIDNSLRPRDIICFELIEPGSCPVMKCYHLKSGSKS